MEVVAVRERPEEAVTKDPLERIAAALESIDDYYRHSCRACEGTGILLVSLDRKDSLGMERDFSGVKGLVADPLAERFDLDQVLVRVPCLHCDGTGRVVPKEQPKASVWGS